MRKVLFTYVINTYIECEKHNIWGKDIKIKAEECQKIGQ